MTRQSWEIKPWSTEKVTNSKLNIHLPMWLQYVTKTDNARYNAGVSQPTAVRSKSQVPPNDDCPQILFWANLSGHLWETEQKGTITWKVNTSTSVQELPDLLSKWTTNNLPKSCQLGLALSIENGLFFFFFEQDEKPPSMGCNRK